MPARPSALMLCLSLLLHAAAQAQDMEYARWVLQSLCSDEMAGRGYVDDGDNTAAFFIEKELKKWDAKPWDYNYYQPFHFQVNTFPDAVELALGGKALTPGVDFLIAPDAPSIKGEFPLTYLEKLPSMAPSGRLTDTAFTVRGFIAVHDSLVRALPPPIREMLHTGLRKAGAKGLIRVTDSKLTWHVSTRQSPLFEAVVREESLAHRPASAKVQVEAKLVKKHRTQNVLAYFPGTGGSDSLILFTAHYDHLGKMGTRTIFRGANDNASGTAMLLSLAKHFSEPEHRLRHDVAFIAFAGEEVGLLGSEFFVKNPIFPLTDIVFLVNLDLVGTGEEGIKVVNGSVHEREFSVLEGLNTRMGLLPSVQKRGKSANSDHYPFSELGVPAFFIYTLGGTTAYHDPGDTPEQLPLTAFEGLFRLILAFAESF